jgi:hypothetical protein
MSSLSFSETLSDWAKSQVISVLEKTGYRENFEVFHCFFEKEGIVHVKWILAYTVAKIVDHKEPVDLRNIKDDKKFFLLMKGLTEAYSIQSDYINHLRSLGHKIKMEYVPQTFKVHPKTYISELEKCDKAVKIFCKRLSQ